MNRAAALALAAAVSVAAGSCSEDLAPLRAGVTSFQVTVQSPTNLGSEQNRLPDTARTVTLSVRALDQDGNLDARFTANLDVWTFYLGTLSSNGTKLQMTNGVAQTTLTLPQTYGATYLWIDDTSDTTNGRTPTYATGTTPTFWYRDAYTADIQTPDTSTGTGADWLDHESFEGKQVTVSASRYGATGKIVVTGVYADGFTVSDVNCATLPCTAQAYDHIFIYTFGLPRDDTGTLIQIGQTLSWYSGGIGEFNGFTEVNFPEQHIATKNPDLSLVPAPVVINAQWIRSGGLSDLVNGAINMEKNESGLLEAQNALVCPLDSDYTTYNQWKLDIGNGCRLNVISAGVLPFDPARYVGQRLPTVIGTLKTVNIGNFNVWILLPRVPSDVVTP